MWSRAEWVNVLESIPSLSLAPGWLAVRICGLVGVIEIKEGIGEDEDEMECSNFTIINLVLKLIGPTHERTLTIIMLLIQVRLLTREDDLILLQHTFPIDPQPEYT